MPALALLLGLALVACAPPRLSPSAPTTTRPDAAAGWLRVDAGSMALSFAVPAQQPGDVVLQASGAAVGACIAAARGREAPKPEPPDEYYRRSVCVRADGQTYFVAVIVARRDDDMFMFGESIGHSQRHADRRERFVLGGYDGAEWTQRNEDQTVEWSRAWLTKDRFYYAFTVAKGDSATFAANARHFLDSFALLDRP